VTNEEIQANTRGLAKLFIERAEHLGLKGKKRDDEALSYFVGAVQGARAAGADDLAEHLGRISYLVIAVRGYFGVNEIANRED
jgi:hypothetical protein